MRLVADKLNGWMAWGRVVTPVLLTILIWIVTTGNTHRDGTIQEISARLTTLSNDYQHQLVSIADRLARIETQLSVQNRKK